MRAIVIASTRLVGGGLSAAKSTAPLVWLADRPCAQHVCESLLGLGVVEADWVLLGAPSDLRNFLGDGRWWGMRFRCHGVLDSAEAYGLVGRLLRTGMEGRRCLLAHANRLLTVSPLVRLVPVSSVALYGTTRTGGASSCSWEWSGWAVVNGAIQGQLPACRGQLERLLMGEGKTSVTCEVPVPVRMETFADCLMANRRAIEQIQGESGRLFVSRGAFIHPGATLVSPVQIGAGVEIAAGATVGPNVTVADHCVIDRGAVLIDAVVLSGTYVGEGVQLASAVVDRGRVVAVAADRSMTEMRGVGVGSLTDHLLARVARFGGQLWQRVVRLCRGKRAVN